MREEKISMSVVNPHVAGIDVGSRSNLLVSAASTSKKMQKYLRLLNLRLDVVVNDVCGQTG